MNFAIVLFYLVKIPNGPNYKILNNFLEILQNDKWKLFSI